MSEEKRRPNANYKLSKEKVEPADIVYHYNRESRLAKAPQAVKNLYKEEAPRRFSLLRPLIGSGPRAMMFASIVVSCVLILVISNFGLSDTHELEGNKLSVQAIRYEGTVIIAIKKTLRNNILSRFSSPYTGAVAIAVSPAIDPDAEAPPQTESIFYHKIFFTLESAETYRFAIPFDAESLTVVFQTERKTLGMTLKPE